MDNQHIGNYLISKPSSANSVFNKFSDQDIYVNVSPNNIIYNNNLETCIKILILYYYNYYYYKVQIFIN